MFRIRTILAAAVLMSTSLVGFAADATVSEDDAFVASATKKLQATFQNLQFEKIGPSELPGVVEIYAGGRILYYAPEKELLIVGEIYGSNGVSITEQKISAFAATKVKGIDKSVALVLGDGPKEVIAFVDPECGYCQRAMAWFEQQNFKNVKLLTYFMPLKPRPQAEAKALEVMCAKPADRRAAMARAFDVNQRADTVNGIRCADGLKALEAQGQIAKAVGVYATPFFMVDGEVIAGFDRNKLSQVIASASPVKPTAAK